MNNDFYNFIYKRPTIVSILVGSITTPIVYMIALSIGRGTAAAHSIWLATMYPAILLFTAFYSVNSPNGLSKCGVIAIFSSYFTALMIMPEAGNLLPLEIIYHFILSIPAWFIGYFIARDKIKKHEKAINYVAPDKIKENEEATKPAAQPGSENN